MMRSQRERGGGRGAQGPTYDDINARQHQHKEHHPSHAGELCLHQDVRSESGALHPEHGVTHTAQNDAEDRAERSEAAGQLEGPDSPAILPL